MKPRVFTILPLLALSGSSWAVAIGHHGGMILHCEPPLFFEEAPARDATVPHLDRFSFTASENTDPDILHIWVDGEPIVPTIRMQRSGRLTVEGRVDPAKNEDGSRVRILIKGVSKDGCERVQAYYVNVRH
jgi:hypothetical protein